MPRGSLPGERRGGRQKGTPNKVTKALKDMILGALDRAGGEEYLTNLASENAGAFCTLLGKVLPTTLTGPNDGAIQTEARVTVELVRSEKPKESST